MTSKPAELQRDEWQLTWHRQRSWAELDECQSVWSLDTWWHRRRPVPDPADLSAVKTVSIAFKSHNCNNKAGDTRSTNLNHKLVQVVLYKKLASVSVNLEKAFSCKSFLKAVANSSISGQKLSGTRLQLCNMIGWPVVIVFVVISFRLVFLTYFIWLSLSIDLLNFIQKQRHLCTIFWRCLQHRQCFPAFCLCNKLW